jgi:sphingomyelin phosphodiesterase
MICLCNLFQGYITPSLTTFSNLNPGYRVYQIDGTYSESSYWVLNHRTVIMNLTATNIYNQTIFVDEYDARTAFNMEYLFPNDWNNLVQRLKTNINGTLMNLVYQYYMKSSVDGQQCDYRCRRGLLCDFITSRAEDPHSCDSIPN